MKKQFYQTSAVAALISLSILSGCKKLNEAGITHPIETFNACRISGFNLIALNDVPVNYTVSYNALGNPISMTQSDFPVPSLGNYNLYFRYDAYGRVTDYQIVYLDGLSPVVWHRYTYPRKNTVIDSLYAYDTGLTGNVHPDPASIDGVSVDNFDEEGRIVRTEEAGSVGITTYDVRGNQVNPFVSYDNKINPYRTNYTWMFVFQNYNANNPLSDSIISYNKFGLPLVLKNPSGVYADFQQPFLSMTINYDCGQEAKKGY